jgi:hypothetical protein
LKLLSLKFCFCAFCGHINFEERKRGFTHSWLALLKNITHSNPKAILVIGHWILRFICNLMPAICNLKKMGTGQNIRPPLNYLWAMV